MCGEKKHIVHDDEAEKAQNRQVTAVSPVF